MAKYERSMTGDFDALVRVVQEGVVKGSISATLEDQANYSVGDVRVAVRVFERYSWLGSNRVSLNVTMVGDSNRLYVAAITSGGSQAMFFKINTFGESAFLKRFAEIVDAF